MTKNKGDNMNEFIDIIYDIANHDEVKKMKNYRQHYDCDCYTHCYNVAYLTYKICKKLKLDYKSATRAAMLHDFFLYDWRRPNGRGLHAFHHGKIACENATKYFKLNDKEKDMIKCHMWPVTLKVPSSWEGIILTLTDKYSSTLEIVDYLYRYITKSTTIRYAGILLHFMIIKYHMQ